MSFTPCSMDRLPNFKTSFNISDTVLKDSEIYSWNVAAVARGNEEVQKLLHNYYGSSSNCVRCFTYHYYSNEESPSLFISNSSKKLSKYSNAKERIRLTVHLYICYSWKFRLNYYGKFSEAFAIRKYRIQSLDACSSTSIQPVSRLSDIPFRKSSRSCIVDAAFNPGCSLLQELNYLFLI